MRLNHHILNLPAKSRRGFSLVEMMFAIGVGVVVIGAVVALSIIAAQNFAATANYVQMDDQSRNALDQISREVRNATALVTNSPTYLRLTNTTFGSGATVSFNASSNTLTLDTVTGANRSSKVLLTGCVSFSFQFFNRVPNPTNYTFYITTNNQFCKVINMNWKCSRNILGSKFQTEIVQTAQVVMRNQVSQ